MFKENCAGGELGVMAGSGELGVMAGLLSVSSLPQTPAIRVVSFREELPQGFVHYHHSDWQRGGWHNMAPSPVGHGVVLLLRGIGLSWRGTSGI